MAESTCRENKGGILEIPDGMFVSGADFDADEPFIKIWDGDTLSSERHIPVPKSMASYLSTHWCGSNAMHDLISGNARRQVQSEIKKVLGISKEE